MNAIRQLLARGSSVGAIFALGVSAALAQTNLPTPTDPSHPIPDVAPPEIPPSQNKPLGDRPGKSGISKPIGKSPDSDSGSAAQFSLGGLDANGDGRLSRKEVSGNAGIKSRFGKLDANGDGYLSPEEYGASASASPPDSGSADVQGKSTDKFH